jgi:hypothetical protein
MRAGRAHEKEKAGYLNRDHELAAVVGDGVRARPLGVSQLLHHRPRKFQHPHYALHRHSKHRFGESRTEPTTVPIW